jgi:hypothetical protein
MMIRIFQEIILSRGKEKVTKEKTTWWHRKGRKKEKVETTEFIIESTKRKMKKQDLMMDGYKNIKDE